MYHTALTAEVHRLCFELELLALTFEPAMRIGMR